MMKSNQVAAWARVAGELESRDWFPYGMARPGVADIVAAYMVHELDRKGYAFEDMNVDTWIQFAGSNSIRPVRMSDANSAMYRRAVVWAAEYYAASNGRKRVPGEQA